MKTMKSQYEIQKSLRRDWGSVNPVSKAFKSKKAYSRKDKSWKNSIEY